MFLSGLSASNVEALILENLYLSYVVTLAKHGTHLG